MRSAGSYFVNAVQNFNGLLAYDDPFAKKPRPFVLPALKMLLCCCSKEKAFTKIQDWHTLPHPLSWVSQLFFPQNKTKNQFVTRPWVENWNKLINLFVCALLKFAVILFSGMCGFGGSKEWWQVRRGAQDVLSKRAWPFSSNFLINWLKETKVIRIQKHFFLTSRWKSRWAWLTKSRRVVRIPCHPKITSSKTWYFLPATLLRWQRST